jgi:hypothetical protein
MSSKSEAFDSAIAQILNAGKSKDNRADIVERTYTSYEESLNDRSSSNGIRVVDKLRYPIVVQDETILTSSATSLAPIDYAPFREHFEANIFSKLGLRSSDTVIQLGCGDGSLLLEACKNYGCSALGYDAHDANEYKCIQAFRDDANISRADAIDFVVTKDVLSADLSTGTVIIVRLDRENGQSRMREKIEREVEGMNVPIIVIGGPFSGWRHEFVTQHRGTKMYVYTRMDRGASDVFEYRQYERHND